MKKQILTIVIILCSFSAIGQNIGNDFYPIFKDSLIYNQRLNKYITPPPIPADIDSVKLNTLCRWSVDSISQQYIPNNQMLTKYVKVNFHFYIHPTLKGNFDEIDDNDTNFIEPYSAYDFINEILNYSDEYFSNNDTMHFQLPNSPIQCITDTKIRLYNAGIYFHYDTIIQNIIFPYRWNKSEYSVNPYYEINVHFMQYNSVYNTLMSMATLTGIREVIFNGVWDYYNYYQSICGYDTSLNLNLRHTAQQLIAKTLNHEVLHNFELFHTIVEGRDDMDYVEDTPTLNEMSEAYGTNYLACTNEDLWCSNNLMDYAQLGIALTPLQLGRAHYFATELIPQYINWDLSSNADLYIKDSPLDNGTVPSTEVVCWNSPDVWIERMNGDTLSNPIGGEQCFVNVRIHNKSKYQTSANNETLSLYWSKAGVDMLWPNDWNGSTFFRCGERRGGFIGSVIIPTIQTKGETIVKILWTPPMPSDYEDCTEFGADKWHFCLAAKIDGGNDPLNINYSNMGAMTVWNNNFAWKNLTIDDPTIDSSVPGGLIAFSKPLGYDGWLKLKFKAKKSKEQGYITDVAEVRLKLSQELYRAWTKGGKQGIAIKDMGKNEIMMLNSTAELSNIYLGSGQQEFILAQTYFLTQKPSPTNTFEFDLFETFADDKIVGGESYIITKHLDGLKAVASNDKVIVKGEEVELEALSIEQNASYVWYNNEQAIDTTLLLSTYPESNTNYVLEIVKNESGNKDYDTVNVIVKNGRINSITPNPASEIITTSYKLSNTITSAFIRIKNINGLIVLNIPVDILLNEKQIYLGNVSSGNYVLELISNTEILDCKTFIKL